MKKLNLTFIVLLVFLTSVSSAFSQKLTTEDIVAEHLKSIGTMEKRNSIKNQVIVGDVIVNLISQKNPPVQGRIVLASAGEKNFLGMNLASAIYPLERFSYDGKEVKVAFVKPGTRSFLGNLIVSNEKFLNESLLGGILNCSWIFNNSRDKKFKLAYNGIKKINGKEAYSVSYLTKGSDFDINLFFDKENFRHVRTEYKRSASAGIGTRPDQSSQFTDTRFRIVEDFSDFRAENGITLPHKYYILYSVTGGRNTSTEIEWKFDLKEFAFNQTLAANTFDIEVK